MPKTMMIARQWAGKIGEASYDGNLGIAELVKFSQKASTAQRQTFDSLVKKGDDRKAWALVQKVVGVKLKGKQFESKLTEAEGTPGKVWVKYKSTGTVSQVSSKYYSKNKNKYDKVSDPSKGSGKSGGSNTKSGGAAEGFSVQEYMFGWYDLKKQPKHGSLNAAKRWAEDRLKKLESGNKKAEKKSLEPDAYGKTTIYPMRVVDSETGKMYPATKRDEANFKKNKKAYLQKEGHSMKIKKSDWEKILKEEKRYLTEAKGKLTSDEAHELYIYTQNDRQTYRQIESVIQNIKRKMKSKKYDHKLAPKLWRYVTDNAAKAYAKEHANGVQDAKRIFPGKVRDEVAKVLADEYAERIGSGDWGKIGEAKIIQPAKDKEPVHITDSDLKDHGIRPSDVKRTFLGSHKGWQIALYQPKKNSRSKYYAIEKFKTDKGSALHTVTSQPEAYKLIKGYNAMVESVQLKEADGQSWDVAVGYKLGLNKSSVVEKFKKSLVKWMKNYNGEFGHSVKEGKFEYAIWKFPNQNSAKRFWGAVVNNWRSLGMAEGSVSATMVKDGLKVNRSSFKESVQLKELSFGKKKQDLSWIPNLKVKVDSHTVDKHPRDADIQELHFFVYKILDARGKKVGRYEYEAVMNHTFGGQLYGKPLPNLNKFANPRGRGEDSGKEYFQGFIKKGAKAWAKQEKIQTEGYEYKRLVLKESVKIPDEKKWNGLKVVAKGVTGKSIKDGQVYTLKVLSDGTVAFVKGSKQVRRFDSGVIKRWLRQGMRGDNNGIVVKESVQLKEGLTIGKKDKAVIIAFADEQPAKGKKLSTDGKRLDGDWMGGRGIAEWKNKKVHLNDLGSAAAKTVQNMVKRFVPRVVIVESEYYHLPLITEATIPSQAFTSPNDRNPQIWIAIDRKNYGGYYKLEKDGWFRLFGSRSRADGYGIMFRAFKATKSTPEYKSYSGAKYSQYKVTFAYLPSEFDDIDDDIPKNYEKTSAYLFILDELNVTPKDVENYIKSNMRKYKP